MYLKLVRPTCEYAEKEVLLTCDTTNDASRRIIVKNPDEKLNQAPIVHIQ